MKYKLKLKSRLEEEKPKRNKNCGLCWGVFSCSDVKSELTPEWAFFSRNKKRRAFLRELMSLVTSKALVSEKVLIISTSCNRAFFWRESQTALVISFQGKLSHRTVTWVATGYAHMTTLFQKSLNFTISRLVLYLSGHNVSPGLSTRLLMSLCWEEPASDKKFRNLLSSQSKFIYFISSPNMVSDSQQLISLEDVKRASC